MSHSDPQARAPKCAAFVNAMRDAFGADQVAVMYVKENDVLLGEEGSRGVPATPSFVETKKKK